MNTLNVIAFQMVYKNLISTLLSNCCTRRGRNEFIQKIHNLMISRMYKIQLTNTFRKNHRQIRIYFGTQYKHKWYPYGPTCLFDTCTVSLHRLQDKEYILTNYILFHLQYINKTPKILCIKKLKYFIACYQHLIYCYIIQEFCVIQISIQTRFKLINHCEFPVCCIADKYKYFIKHIFSLLYPTKNITL